MYITVILILISLMLILWVWAIVDILRTLFKTPVQKSYWFLIVLLFPVLGALLYFQIGKKSIVKEPKQFNPKFHHAG